MQGQSHSRMVHNRTQFNVTRSTFSHFIPIFLILLGLTACQADPITPNESSTISTGRVLLWHDWGADGSSALETLIENYTRVNPGVTVIAVDMSDENLQDRFIQTARLGLGPDLLIGSSDWMVTFLDEGVIAPISTEDFEQNKFNIAAVQLTKHNDQTYGIPLTIQSPVLYYNRDVAPLPVPNTFSDLVEEANAGQTIGISIESRTAYGAISAFGPRLVNTANDPVIAIQPEGLIAWFNWLKENQENPAFFLNQDEETLSRLFLNQEVAFYLGPYSFLQTYYTLEAAGEAPFELGIAPFPREESNFANPLIQSDLFYFNHASSNRQKQLALDFAKFMTNSEQSSFLLRELSLPPANFRVRVDRRIYPLVQPFTQSASLGTTLPTELESILLGQNGDAVYTAILSGAREPEDAFCEWHNEIKAVWAGPVESVTFCQS